MVQIRNNKIDSAIMRFNGVIKFELINKLIDNYNFDKLNFDYDL